MGRVLDVGTGRARTTPKRDRGMQSSVDTGGARFSPKAGLAICGADNQFAYANYRVEVPKMQCRYG